MFLFYKNYDEMSKSEESIAFEMPTMYNEQMQAACAFMIYYGFRTDNCSLSRY